MVGLDGAASQDEAMLEQLSDRSRGDEQWERKQQ